MGLRLLGATGLLCLLASACVAPPEGSTGNARPEAAIQSGTGSEPDTATAATKKNDRTAALTAGPPPEKLIGMTGDEISALFGRPVFVRRDPPAEFWRYRAASCVLELFFYRQGGAWRVDHVEMRRGDSTVTNQPACIAALRAAPRAS